MFCLLLYCDCTILRYSFVWIHLSNFACRDLQVRQTNMDHCCTLSACYNFYYYLIA